MTTGKNITTMLTVALIVIVIPLGFFLRKLPPPQLTPSEKELLGFSDQPVSLSAQPSQATFSGLVSPVTAAANPAEKARNIREIPPTTENASARKRTTPQPLTLASLPVVSVISYDGSTKTAIIDNHVVTEGSKLDGGLIVKIEETRVLMRKGGKDVWLTTN